VQSDAKRLSARADRRQAARQRQEREREEQQWVEQLCDREPKPLSEPLLLLPRFDISIESSDPWPAFSRGPIRYLTREIG
jgi:hypothetical protein